MSGLGNGEDYKQWINELFKEKKEAEPVEEKEEKVVRHRVRIPEAPAQTKEQEEEALKYAKAELETIREAFLDFQEEVGDTVIMDYLLGDLEEFIEACYDMEAMLGDDFKKENITENGLTNYEKMRKIRSRVLNGVYKKYKEGK